MYRHLIVGLIVLLWLAVSQVAADLVITLEPKDADMNPIAGPVDPGTQVVVDILLSVTDDDSPLADLRGLGFDFTATSPGIEVSEFTWLLDQAISDDLLYFQDPTLPVPSVAYTLGNRVEGMILDLDETPIRVAAVTITVNDNGVLDTRASDPESEALFRADFASRVDFSLALGNLSGGTFDFSLKGPDSDGDGVPDDEDAFPDDPEESVDTDGDGIGDNADEDDDGDGVPDDEDAFPLNPAETEDTDGDGIGNNTDIDDDGDGVFDVDDDLPLDPNEQVDTDGDGIGDNADPDDDNDGLLDAEDPDPLSPDNAGDATSTDSDDDNTNVGSRTTGGFCGLGMAGASIFIILGLSATCLHRRSDRQRSAKQ